MKALQLVLAGLALLTLGAGNCVAGDEGAPAAKHTFAFGGEDFLLDGKPFQIIGGEMHPQRVPHEYWRQRIQMAKAMGINTMPIYVFWNAIEQEEGKFDFTGENNIGEFLKIAREEGMWVVMRAGPYACGEWDLGGLPWWLLKTPDIKLRCSDPRFTGPVALYFHELAKIVRPNMVENGGAILMVQIENEYGSYPRRDHAYLVWLRDQWLKEGVNGPFITADGPGAGYLHGLVIPGVAIGLDTGTNEGDFAYAHKINPGVPVMSTEVYPGWLRHWGEGDWKPSNCSGLIKFFMDSHKSFSLYVFHGGTNFGFTAGANGGDPSITSYDYGAPLNEQGCPTPAYFAYRKQLAAYLPAGQTLPEIPATIPTMTIPEIKLERWSSLWEQLPAPITAEEPKCFETLGQNQGFVVYRTKIPAGEKGTLSMPLHGYPQMYVDGVLTKGLEVPARDKEATLEILVEAMGHINFQGIMDQDRKGILGPVKLNGTEIKNWEMLLLPVKSDWAMTMPKTTPIAGRIGGIFKGEFNLDSVADTYLDMSNYKKGVLWVNGHNLGRHWSEKGPQKRLYCPAPWLKKGTNTIVVLDVELTEPQHIAGFTTVVDKKGRSWEGSTLQLDGLTPAASGTLKDQSEPQDISLTPVMARQVCLEAQSTYPGSSPGEMVSVAEIDVLDKAGNVLGHKGWKIAYVDSEDTGGEHNVAEHAIDGDPATFWHTQWEGGMTPLPHEIVIDLGRHVEISGLRICLRAVQANGKANGRIKEYQVFTVEGAFKGLKAKGR